MGSVIMLSGPIGAGKTTVARELVPLLPERVAYLEGDTFWSFIAKDGGKSRVENFRVIMRSMTAAALPFARMDYTVLIDFSIPPDFLGVAARILKEISLDYVMLRPDLETCEARAASRKEGAITDYRPYREFYSLFEVAGFHVLDEDEEPAVIAKRIREGWDAGLFRV